jgi:CheY-like chemotaxis protein
MQVDENIGPVLVIDDDHAVRVRLRMLLESAGYIVFTATDGQMALTLLHRLSFVPRLIILDLVMPILDGWQFLEVFRSEPDWESTVVVVHASADVQLPRGVRRLRRDANDAAILKLARETCRRILS